MPIARSAFHFRSIAHDAALSYQLGFEMPQAETLHWLSTGFALRRHTQLEESIQRVYPWTMLHLSSFDLDLRLKPFILSLS